MNTRLSAGAIVTASMLLALLWPVSCMTTLRGVRPGARDPNITSCDGAFVRQLGTIRAYEGDRTPSSRVCAEPPSSRHQQRLPG